MIKKCAKYKCIKVTSFDLTQAFLEMHIFALGLKATLDVKFIL